MSPDSILYTIAVWAIPGLLAITLHEAAHGYVAYALGDSTAKNLGRISANPLRHIDPVNTILVPIVMLVTLGFMFGAAKPVPVDPRNFRHPKIDMGLMAAAGPIANWLMACLWAVVILIAVKVGLTNGISKFAYQMGQVGLFFNLLLATLNLLPIPPLDGSKILIGVLPFNLARLLVRYERVGIVLLFIVIAAEVYALEFSEKKEGFLFDALLTLVKPFEQIIESLFNIQGIIIT